MSKGKRISVDKIVDNFSDDMYQLDKFLAWAKESPDSSDKFSGGFSAKKVSYEALCYELAIIRLQTAFERMLYELLVTALNKDPSQVKLSEIIDIGSLTAAQAIQYVQSEGHYGFNSKATIIKSLKNNLQKKVRTIFSSKQ